MMNLLLKYEGYPPAVVAALVLHVFLLWIIFERQFEPADYVQIDQPISVAAVAVQQNPQQLRRIEQLEQQRQRDLATQRQREADQRRAREAEEQQAREREAERQRQAEIQRQQAQRQQAEEAERQRLISEEAERRERERVAAAETERRRLLEQQQLTAQQEAQQEAERQRLAQQQQSQAVENDLRAQYAAIIHDLIQRNWSIPPSARCNMTAVVAIRMTPVGDIVSSTITESSGDAVFDRSVLQAVDRVGSFPEIRELPNSIFERNFRQFTLTFQPQDLLRC